MAVSKEKIKEFYELLPKLNCGFCGLGGCGQLTRSENVRARKQNAGGKGG